MSCTVLIATDDVVVRNTTRWLLEREGHDVLIASNGIEALDLSRRYDREIDLLLTDQHLPGMDGSKLATEILAQRPEISVLVMTGKLSRGDLTPLPSLLKPFSPEVFRDKIREVLRRPCLDE